MMTDKPDYMLGEGYGRATGSGYDFGYGLGPSSMGYGHGCSEGYGIALEGYGDMISEGTGSGKSIGFGLEWKNHLPSGHGQGVSNGAGVFNGNKGWGYGATGGTYNNET